MINFTVGPVQSEESVREIGYEQVPYFRTEEFSQIMLENEKLMLEFANASFGSKAVFITGSGTASMEAAIMNTFNENDKLLVIVGGSFGQRFSQICDVHNIQHTDINLEFGKAITAEQLSEYEGKGYTGLLVNIHETSTGVHYDLDMLGDFCKKNNIFFVVDAISSFLADEVDLQKNNVDIMITGSQKALACPPGISIIILSPRAIDRVNANKTKCYYLDLKSALKDGERGQTPFTPAVSILRQINKRLNNIKANGGVESERAKIAELAEDFRKNIGNLPLEIVSDSLSNAVTPLAPKGASANDIFLTLKDEYGIWVCPNGGNLKDKVFRVGHIGALTKEDNKKLIDALNDLVKRGILF